MQKISTLHVSQILISFGRLVMNYNRSSWTRAISLEIHYFQQNYESCQGNASYFHFEHLHCGSIINMELILKKRKNQICVFGAGGEGWLVATGALVTQQTCAQGCFQMTQLSCKYRSLLYGEGILGSKTLQPYVNNAGLMTGLQHWRQRVQLFHPPSYRETQMFRRQVTDAQNCLLEAYRASPAFVMCFASLPYRSAGTAQGVHISLRVPC